MIVMVTKMTTTTMVFVTIFQYWTPQVAYDDGETVSERIIYRYLEGDLYMEA